MCVVVCFKVRAGLEQISSFLSTHAREVVFLDFNHFYGMQNLHHEKLVTMLKEVFGEKLCPVVFAQEVFKGSSCWTGSGCSSNYVTYRLDFHIFCPLMLIWPLITHNWFLCFDHLRCKMMIITSKLFAQKSRGRAPHRPTPLTLCSLFNFYHWGPCSLLPSSTQGCWCMWRT